MAKRRQKKIPLGTKRSPWYAVPEHHDNGKKIPSHFIRCTPSGVQKEMAIPAGSIIKRDTSY